MLSQTPKDDRPTPEYVKGWAAMWDLILEDRSFSGRERNCLYLNLGDGSFADVSAVSDADAIGDSRALAVVDWDEDGRLDLLLRNRTAPRLQLFRNRSTSRTHFVEVELEGVSCIRDAIGARVQVEAGGRTLTRTLHAGDGFLAQSTKRLLFGLGASERVERLRVLWPDGGRDEYADLAADTRYRIRQGESAPTPIRPRTIAAFASMQPTSLEGVGSRATRLPLFEKLPMSPIGVPAFDRPERTLADLQGGLVLLNFWSTTCAACMEEFGTFEERRDELRDAGVRLVPLCMDGQANPARASEILRRFGLETDAGFVDPSLLDVLELVMQSIVGELRQTPLPLSMLLDARGSLVAIYFGALDTADLVRDAAVVKTMDPADLGDVRLVPGLRLTANRRGLGPLARELGARGRADLAEFYRSVARSRR